LSTREKRLWVEWAQQAYQLSQRRACLVSGFSRRTIRYRSCCRGQEALRRRIKEIAAVRISYGYRRLHVLLRREGWPINHKRVYRLYSDEGLGLKRKRAKRRRAAVVRRQPDQVTRPNERWAMDFMHDQFADGRKFRVLTVIDVFTRECLAVEARPCFRGHDVASVLGKLTARHGKPRSIQCDQGTEFTSLAVDHWAYWNKVGLDFSRRGRPGDNARNEAFNSVVRRECLTHHYFFSLEEARMVLDSWKEDYNNERPHGSLGQIPPVEYRLAWTKSRGSARLPEMT
jgi:putative transposase